MSLRSQALALSLCSAAATAQSWRIETILGLPRHRDHIPATSAGFSSIDGLAADANGRIYLADSPNHRIRRVNRDGTIETIAGSGSAALAGDNGPATKAALSAPYGIAIDGAGTIHIADFGNARIRRIDPAGNIRTVAPGAALTGPRNVAASSSGDLYVSDYSGNRVLRITPAGAVIPIAGAGTSTPVSAPAGIAVDGLGSVYVADSGNRRVLRISGSSTVVVLNAKAAGIGLGTPLSLSLDAFGTLLIGDSQNNQVIQRAHDGTFTVISAGSLGLAAIGEVTLSPRGVAFVSDRRKVVRLEAGEPPRVVAGGGGEDLGRLEAPIGIATGAAGEIYVAEEAARRIRKLTRDGELSTAAQGSLLEDPVAVAHDPLFGLRIADYQSNRILGVTGSGELYTVAGDGQAGYAGDNDFAVKARWNKPRALAFDAGGNLYIADSGNHRVRRIGLDGRVTTVAGIGSAGFATSGAIAIRAPLNTPAALAAGPNGELYIADAGNHSVVAVSPSGILTRVAGTGTAGNSGDGGPALRAQLRFPTGLAVARDGTLFIADTYNHRIRRVAPGGTIDTVAGDGKPGLAGDDGPAVAARLQAPAGLAFDAGGNLCFADLENDRVRCLMPQEAPPPAAPDPPAPEPAAPVTELVLRNGASLRPGPIAPGQLVSIAGLPANAEVRIDGRPAPRTAAAADTVVVQAPYGLTPGSNVAVEVVAGGRILATNSVAVAAASPGVYAASGGTGQAVLLLAGGTHNSAANPAPRGSVASLFLTGAGLLTPVPGDGEPAAEPLPKPVLPVAVRVGPAEADLLWVGAAPGLSGVVQVNFRLPGLFTAPGEHSLRVSVGGIDSQDGITVVLR